MKLSIGNLSKTFQLSDEALRYYERKGLLKPVRQHPAGYRTFSRVDIQRISNIKRMQTLGFSLAQIKKAYQGISGQDLTKMYQQEFAALQKDMLYKKRVYQHMKLVLHALQSKTRSVFKPKREKLEKAYARVFNSVPEMWEQAQKDKDLRIAFQHQPLVSFCTFFDVLGNRFENPVIKKGLVTFASDAAALSLSLKRCREIDASEAVVCVCRLVNGQFDLDKLFDPLEALLLKERLQVSDLIFTHKLFDYRDETGQIIHYTRLIVPVKRQI